MLLILASASPARRATLSAAHIRHVVQVSEVDEDEVLLAAQAASGELTAAEQVLLLAQAKAQAVAQHVLAAGNPYDAAVVVGCDSMFAFGGEVVGKPHSAAVAIERLRKMSGHAGELFTGHCVIDLVHGDSRAAQGVSKATVFMAHMSEAEIAAYVASGEPLEVAGSFTIDGRGGPFVERIEGDHHGVVGISLPLLRTLLGELGFGVTDFWDNS